MTFEDGFGLRQGPKMCMRWRYSLVRLGICVIATSIVEVVPNRRRDLRATTTDIKVPYRKRCGAGQPRDVLVAVVGAVIN